MSAQNVFFVVLGILTLAVCLALSLLFQPAENPFLFLNWDKIQTLKSEPVSEPPRQIQPSKTAGVVFEKDHYVSVMRYNGTTFEPRILVIDRGESVRFLNTSTLAMRVQITQTGNVPVVTTYTQANSSGKGGYYELSLPTAGVWSVANMNGSVKNNALIYVR